MDQDATKLTKLSGFLREALDKPDVAVARMDLLGIFQALTFRPVADGDFPDIGCLNLLVSRMLHDEKRLAKLRRTPAEPLVALLPLLSQIATSYNDWADAHGESS